MGKKFGRNKFYGFSVSEIITGKKKDKNLTYSLRKAKEFREENTQASTHGPV